jgi:squalene-hopene/tetraprenyl-beta-curcumene cyclase
MDWDGSESETPSQRPAAVRPERLAAPLRTGILRARQYLLNEQRPSGAWTARQQSDVSHASQLILLSIYFDRPDADWIDRACQSLLESAHKRGGWSRYPDGPVDVTVSTQAYLALKCAGYEVTSPVLRGARRAIREAGGADRVDLPTRFLLALFSQIEFSVCTPILPEQLPSNRRFARQSKWLDLLLHLSIVWTHRPIKQLESHFSIRELFVDNPDQWPDCEEHAKNNSWRRLHKSTLLWLERKGWTFRRRRALCGVQKALAARAETLAVDNASLTEVFWLAVALHTLGHDVESNPLRSCWNRIERLADAEGQKVTGSPRPNTSSLDDTSLAIAALANSGIAKDCANIRSGVDWIVDRNAKQITGQTWDVAELARTLEALSIPCRSAQVQDNGLPPGIQVASSRESLLRDRSKEGSLNHKMPSEIAAQLLDQLWQAQRSDGSWPATANRSATGAADVTAAVLQALGAWGYRLTHPAVERAVDWLRREQQGDGSWDSHTGVRFVHGTSSVVGGLAAVGLSNTDPAILAGVNWLLAQQLPTGGWGEVAEPTGPDPWRPKESASASQTAWALSALVAAGQHQLDAVARGIRFLLETQEEDGSWNEPHFNLRSPRGGYWFRNELHSVCYPLSAMSRWAVTLQRTLDHPPRVELRLVAAEQ